MKKLLVLLLTMVTFFEVSHCEEEQSNYFVDNFLKYSTFYTSVSVESPFTPKQKFAVNTDEGTFEETTEEIEGSYNLSIGIRKLARLNIKLKKVIFMMVVRRIFLM